jgi:hypothetical protein
MIYWTVYFGSDSGKAHHYVNSVNHHQEHRPFKDGILKEQRAWNLVLLIPRRVI